MKERPILFSAPMVRAILDGRKTQTRRLYKPRQPAPYEVMDELDNGKPWPFWFHPETSPEYQPVHSPYGVAGDRLWVRESIIWKPEHDNFYFAADNHGCGNLVYSRLQKRSCPSIHMPRWASRITLEVTDVRVERLQEITEDDARAEGVKSFPRDPEGDCWTDGTHRTAFQYLWGEINGWDGQPGARAPWFTNPWVWVISFRKLEQQAQAAE